MNYLSSGLATGFFKPARRAFLFAVCTLLALAASWSFADDLNDKIAKAAPPLEWKLESSHARLALGGADFFLCLRVKAAVSPEEKRPPLDLALVFDRSGSMNEDAKIGYVRKAARLVVDNLTRQDHVAFVAFNQDVQVLVPLHPVVNREYLHHRIDELQAEGWTNLSGGLLEGCAQLDKRLKEPGRHHVILLTDGLANRGVTDANGLVGLVQRCSKRGITVTTVGVGIEYDEKVLARMAQAGGGRFVHVAKPEQIPKALEQELGALLAVVAQNVKLKIELPPAVTVHRVFGRDDPRKPGVVELALGDLTSGEERVVVLKCRAESNGMPTEPVALPAVLTYDDVAEAHRTEAKRTLTIKRGAAGEASEAGPALAYAQLVEGLDKIALAVEGMDRKIAAEILELRQNQYPALKKAAQDSRDQDFVNKAFLFEHYARDLQELIDQGALHEHNAERLKLQKELYFRRYLMDHHKHPD